MLSPASIGSLEQSIRYGSQEASSLLAGSLATAGSLGGVGPLSAAAGAPSAAPSWVPSSDFASARSSMSVPKGTSWHARRSMGGTAPAPLAKCRF
jgi:hypothetical protein